MSIYKFRGSLGGHWTTIWNSILLSPSWGWFPLVISTTVQTSGPFCILLPHFTMRAYSCHGNQSQLCFTFSFQGGFWGWNSGCQAYRAEAAFTRGAISLALTYFLHLRGKAGWREKSWPWYRLKNELSTYTIIKNVEVKTEIMIKM